MKARRFVAALALAIAVSGAGGDEAAPVPARAADAGQTLAERLLAAYRRIDTIACEIRKTMTGRETVRMLSRVFYQRPNRVHVQTVAPVSRTVVCDGRRLYYHQRGDKRGFSRPVDKLEEPWLSAVLNVPATPVENLLHLHGVAEEALPGTPDRPVRRGYDTGRQYVVLSCDAEGRLAGVEFYAARGASNATARCDYGDFRKVAEDCWIPCLHKIVTWLPDGEAVSQVRHVDNLQVNGSVASNLFNADLFFKDVTFSEEFRKTYEP